MMAEQINHAAPPRRQPRWGASAMSNFRVKTKDLATPDSANTPAHMIGGDSLQLVFTDKEALTGRFFLTCLTLANDEAVTAPQTIAYYLSAMAIVFPSMKPDAQDWIKHAGYRVELVETEEDLAEMEEIQPWRPTPELAMMFGQSVLIVFKNISAANYLTYIRSRVKALKAHVGAFSDSIDGGEVFSLAKAMVIRAALGNNVEFKKKILNLMLATREVAGAFPAACNYVCGILEWNEMTAIVIIYKMLLLTSSPVINDKEIRDEVLHLAVAYEKINQFEYPQYFRIMASRSRARVLERHHYQVLTTVAQVAQKDQTPSLAQFVASVPENNLTVIRLVNIHRRFLARTAEDIHLKAAAFLTAVEEEDVDEELPPRA
uniref:ORF1 n=1 Tax=Maize suscal virus TaxID=2979120 RepID=A0A977J6G6_9VIRU|nr:ORF1 [Maize suscal virus]